MEASKINLIPNHVYPASVVRIIDGDTIMARLELGFDITLERPCRIRGYDSPEINSSRHIDALKAIDALAAVLPVGTNFIVLSPSWSVDRYCRIIGDWYLPDGTPVSTLLPQEYIVPKRP